MAPLWATRGARIGLLGFFGLLSVAILLFASGVLSDGFRVATLTAARHLLIMLGMPVAAILLSEVPIREGIASRTLLYPLLGPASRRITIVVRSVVTAALLAIGTSILLLVIRALLGSGWDLLLRELLALWLGSFAYSMLFGAIHVLAKRGLIAGLVFLFFADLPLGRVPFALRNLSPSYHVGVIGQQQVEIELPIFIALPETSVLGSSVGLLVLGCVFLVAATWLFERKNLGELC